MIIDSPTISGSFLVTGSATVTGSLSVSQGITGSLFGTSSWAVSSSRAVSSSYALTASYAMNGGGGLSGGTANYIPLWTSPSSLSTSSLYQSGSNVGIGTLSPTGALDVRGAVHLGTGTPTSYLGAQHTVEITATGSNAALTLIGGSATTEIWIDNTPTKALMFGAASPGVAADGDWHFSTYSPANSWNDRLVIKNDTGNVGIGTSNPTTTLDVNGQIGFPYIILTGGTSAFGLNYFQAQAREIDTGIAATFACNGNPGGYGYDFQFVANQSSNGLLLIGDNTTTSHIFATDAYPGGAGWPLKFRVANTNESWGGISDLMTLTPNQKVGIGSNTPTTKLYVLDSSNSTVAHFEGVNGYPIEIVTANTSMTVGYAAPIGSIGNGAGQLYVKTGSADIDWAPISYQGSPLAEKTFSGIDLSAADYYITQAGVYEVTTADKGNSIFLPDPATLTGQSITIINTDSATKVKIDPTYAFYTKGSTSQPNQVGLEDMVRIVSINGKWRSYT